MGAPLLPSGDDGIVVVVVAVAGVVASTIFVVGGATGIEMYLYAVPCFRHKTTHIAIAHTIATAIVIAMRSRATR